MIIDEINKAKIEALKTKNTNAKVALEIVKNKYMVAQVEKRVKNEEMTDQDTVQILLKTQKELAEEAENYKKAGNEEQYNQILAQKTLIETFLPKMMSVDEIREIINGLEDKSMKNVMTLFKTQYAGKVNMSDVSAVMKTL